MRLAEQRHLCERSRLGCPCKSINSNRRMSTKPTLADTLSRFKIEHCRAQLQASFETPALHTVWQRFKTELHKSTDVSRPPTSKRLSAYESLSSLRSSQARVDLSRPRYPSTSESFYTPLSLSRRSGSSTSLSNTSLSSSVSRVAEKTHLVDVLPLDYVLRGNEALEKMSPGEERALSRRYTEELQKLAILIETKLHSYAVSPLSNNATAPLRLLIITKVSILRKTC